MGTGENSGTWGTITNTNLGTAIEEAICESADVSFSQDSLTLSLSDSNASQPARHLRLNLTGTGSAGISLTVPDIEKNYIVKNALATDVDIKNSSGGNVTVQAGKSTIVYSTGSGVVDVIDSLTSLVVEGALAAGSGSVGGTFTITGSFSAASTLNVGSNASVGGTLTVNNDFKNTSGNLTVDPATQIVEVKGNGSDTEGQIQLNCHANSHGQIIKAQPHSEGVTNTMLLPKGSNSTLVSEAGTATMTNKTLGATSVDGTFNVSGNASVGGTLAVTNTITGSSTVSDADGDLRDIPLSTKVSGNYTLAIGDVGNQVTVNSANVVVTVPDSVFSVGDIVSLVSVNGCTATIACTAINAVKAGDLAATALHTLDANGVASIMFSYTADLAVLTGNIS